MSWRRLRTLLVREMRATLRDPFTIGILIASGIALTTSPVVYQTLERAQFFKVGLTLVFLAVAIVAAISMVAAAIAVIAADAR